MYNAGAGKMRIEDEAAVVYGSCMYSNAVHCV